MWNWVALVIVIVLVLLYFGHYWIGAPIVIGAGLALAGPIMMRGGWECVNMTRRYGQRCVDNGAGLAQADCERRCFGPREFPEQANISKAAATIIKFTHGSGWNFPVPRAFLEQLETDPKMQARYYSMSKSDFSIGSVIAETKEYNDYMQKTLGVHPVVTFNGREPVTIGSEPLQYFDISTLIGNYRHGNAVIVNNTTRRIIHIEPNFGVETIEKWAANTKEIQRLFSLFIAAGYTFETTSSCPDGLQSVSGLGGVCTTWSLFLAIWAALNPSRTVNDVFQYAIGIGPNVDVLLRVYVLYLKSQIRTVTYTSDEAKSYYNYYVTKGVFGNIHNVNKHIKELSNDLYSLVRPTNLKIQDEVRNTLDRLSRGEQQYTIEERVKLLSMLSSESFWQKVLPKFASQPAWLSYLDMLEHFGPDSLSEAPPLPLEENKLFLFSIASYNGVKRTIIDQILNGMNEENNADTYAGALRAYSSYKYPNKTFKQIVYETNY